MGPSHLDFESRFESREFNPVDDQLFFEDHRMTSRALSLDPKKGWCVWEHAPSEIAEEHVNRIVGIVPLDPLFELTEPAVELAKQIRVLPDLLEIAKVAALAGDNHARLTLFDLQMLPEEIDLNENTQCHQPCHQASRDSNGTPGKCRDVT
ncbi:hypothetical protein AB1K70_20235 [Bremerella sp. JC770]|uniref:hypothetical protein n=1 Tax=Bremerella sp. JC770 TaxID=3232137 RepID=UPI00345AD4F8